MLVLSRRVGEELIIDGHIRVTIVGVNGQKVRVGVEAPPSVRVDRQEVHVRRVSSAEPVRKRQLSLVAHEKG